MADWTSVSGRVALPAQTLRNVEERLAEEVGLADTWYWLPSEYRLMGCSKSTALRSIKRGR
jgi:hypothetical protein